MTNLSKPIDRRVHDRLHGLLTVRLAPEGILIREYGRRTWYPAVTFGRVLMLAAQIKADGDRRERAARRRKAR